MVLDRLGDLIIENSFQTHEYVATYKSPGEPHAMFIRCVFKCYEGGNCYFLRRRCVYIDLRWLAISIPISFAGIDT